MAAENDVDMTYASGDLQRGATDASDGLARMLAGLHLDAATVLHAAEAARPGQDDVTGRAV